MTYPLEILHEEELGQDPKGDIVFVHGICHDARCWKNFIDFFSAQGYRCSALSLRACLKSFDKKGRVGDNRKKQAGDGENASIPK